MIKELKIKKFKKFKNQTIPLISESVSLIAGTNNSGKSSILHALAIWEFCRTIIESEKGFQAFLAGARTQGLGLADDEFSPILIPSLNHLWTNLASQKKSGEDEDGYTLRIRASWTSAEGSGKELEFGLALANDRMFVRATLSNLLEGDVLPKVAYLPPFAGITDRETRLPLAIRRRRIGEGLAGAVLRNVLLDLYSRNLRVRQELRGGRSKIRDQDLRALRETDPWELLQQALRLTFGAELSIDTFREEYHSYIKVHVTRGTVIGYRIKPFPNFKARDLMVEGSGFLQWLSVYALATDPELTTLLLDEPDAHLHSSLQLLLLKQLDEIVAKTKKQILIATHSSEILRNSAPDKILEVRTDHSPRFLSSESQKVGLLAGLGAEYSPRIDRLKQTKHLLLLEGEYDCRVLKQVAQAMNVEWPQQWVEWKSATGHKERKQLFLALAGEIDGLVAVSLRDRDDEPSASVGERLDDRGHTSNVVGFHCLKWRRRHIESYLLWPPALAAASGRSEESIVHDLQESFGIAVGHSFKDANPPVALLDIRGKE
ncbi:MAG: ATP-binding protein, partial [Proteobacteria bacterium]